MVSYGSAFRMTACVISGAIFLAFCIFSLYSVFTDSDLRSAITASVYKEQKLDQGKKL